MPDQPKPYYLTTPIYYVNARPHIGHAYTTIVGDVLARRHRLLGEEVYYLTGTDEHGQKIERSATAAGIPPQQFTDQVSAQFRTLWDRMGITYNDYIRTTEPRHKTGVQKLFRKLYENGHIYLDSYTGAYCVSDEAFVDAPVGSPCPDCGKLLEEVTEENFFFKLSEFQEKLIDLIESNELTIAPDSARNEVLKFLQGPLGVELARLAEVEGSPEFKRVSKLALDKAVETGVLKRSTSGLAYVPGALRDLSVSRSSFTWGIPVPEPAASASTQKHVIYVWLDALANYMTAVGYGAEDRTDIDAAEKLRLQQLFETFWPADLHLVGKEITRFHCVYWPAFLMAADLPTPKAITANGWLLFDNAKMSKSKGNVVRSETILEGFGSLCPPPLALKGTGFSPSVTDPTKKEGALAPEVSQRDRDLFATDVLRYFLLREIPFGQDGSFSFDAMITRYNADLANGYGNLVSRTLSMIEKYFDGAIPSSSNYSSSVALESSLRKTQIFDRFVNGNPSGVWQIHLPSEASALSVAFDSSLRRFHFIWAFQACGELIRMVDSEITSRAPWKVIVGISDEEMKQKRSDILYLAAESIRILTALLYPILPYATARVWQQLGLGDIEAAARNGELKDLHWGGLQPGTKLGTLGPIFPRADKGLAQIMIDLENPHPAPEPTSSTDPAAGPRTASLDEPSGTLTVGGSSAHTTGPSTTPSHTEAPASGIFAAAPSTLPPPLSSTPSDASPEITIDDFVKVELRVAEVKVCERIPKADKLLRLEVDLGPLGTRQILSGIAEHYTPEEMVGKRIIVITNLAPRKMRGLESHGMLLAASEEGGKPYLATVPEGVPVGTRLK